ncbi:MAG TPA: zf-HC2 domain-containing protein [Thermoanaerobaculia bacterium]
MRSGAERGDRLHRRVWDLLPWYANGTLEDGERRTVESHLAACSRCREELSACRGLGELLQQVPEVAPAPHPAHLARILEKIGDHERTAWQSPLESLRNLLTATPRPVRWALAAQLVLVLGLGLGLSLHRQPRQLQTAPAAYRTLSDGPAATSSTIPSSRLRLVFAPGTTEQEIRDLLLGIRGQIVSGPSSLGVYTVEVPTGPDPLDDVLAHIRKHRQVSLAEPVAGEGR